MKMKSVLRAAKSANIQNSQTIKSKLISANLKKWNIFMLKKEIKDSNIYINLQTLKTAA